MAKKFSRRDVLKAGAVIASGTALSLAGCSSPPKTDGSPAAQTPKSTPKVQVEVPKGGKILWFDPRKTAANTDAVTEAQKQFFRQTGINIEDINIAESLNATEKIRIMISAGSIPDVWHQDMGVPAYLRDGIPLALDEYIMRDNVDLSHISADVIATHKIQGKIYTIPLQIFANCLVYNADLFDQAGVPYPPSTWDDPSWTWDAFLDRAKALTKWEGNTMVQGGSIAVAGNWWVPWCFGGAYTDENHTKMTVNTPEMVEALTFMQDMRYKHRVDAFGTHLTAMRKGAPAGISDVFRLGKIGMRLIPTNDIAAYLQDTHINWKLAPMPRSKGVNGSYMSPGGVAILQASKEKERAWQFAKWTADIDNGYNMAMSYGRPPVTKGGLDRWVRTMEARKPGAHFQVVADLLNKYTLPMKYLGFQAYNRLYEQLRVPINDMINSVMAENNRKTPAEAIKLCEEKGNAELAKG